VAPATPAGAVRRAAQMEVSGPESALANEEHRLVQFEHACRALEIVKTIPEVLEIRAVAQAMHVYLQQHKHSETLLNDATELKLRADRRLGQMLLAMAKNKGAATPSHEESAPPTLDALKIDRNLSHRTQRIARTPAPSFEAYIVETRAAGGTLSVNGLMRHIRAIGREAQREAQAGKGHDPHTARALAALVEALREPLLEVDLPAALKKQALSQATVRTKQWLRGGSAAG
jgi:hypothetical protein